MPEKSLLRSAPALRVPCCAWVPARALLARAFAGTNPCGCALPAALGHRPKPSVAWAFAGTSVHRTLALIPAHPLDCCLFPAHPATLASPGFAVRGKPAQRDNPCGCAFPAALGYRPKPSLAWAFAGTSVHRTLAFSRLTPRSFNYIPPRPWFFSARRAKSAVFTLLHSSNTYVFEECAVLPCTALAGC